MKLSWLTREGGRCTISHVGFSPGVLYAFPPTPLLTVVLGRIRASLHPILLLAPTWPRQPWYSSLVELSVAHAVHLPSLGFPSCRGISHTSMYNLHTWTFLVTGIEDRDSLTALPASWHYRYGFQPRWSTSESGLHSVLGVRRDRMLLSLFL